MDISGKVAIVTGGAIRIGRAICESLASEGVAVVVHYGTSADSAAKTVAKINDAGGQAIAVKADLLDGKTSADKVFSAASNAFGAVDFLINNASIFESDRLADLDEETLERHLAINFKAPLWMSQRFASESFAAEPDDTNQTHVGHIIIILDWRALRPEPSFLSYSLAKSALASATETLAVDLAPNIRVNAIAPGAIVAPAGDEESHKQRIRETIPLKMSGTPGDIANAVLFLLKSDFITGEILRVSGGER
ncbi:MAG: short-chain dehydrogenase [Planctomycetaceae bacterium]|nr:short-chain dehydrogenase [Planctomycetaceae bacterium]